MIQSLFTSIAAFCLATVLATPTPAVPGPPPTLPEEARTTATVTRIIDGDTLVTTRGTIRVIGIDAPERGQSGFGPATQNAQRLAPVGSTVVLARVAGRHRDRFGRFPRYVFRHGVDFGGAQIKSGLATARYDSRDGHGWHPKQADYICWDRRYPTSPAACSRGVLRNLVRRT